MGKNMSNEIELGHDVLIHFLYVIDDLPCHFVMSFRIRFWIYFDTFSNVFVLKNNEQNKIMLYIREEV